MLPHPSLIDATHDHPHHHYTHTPPITLYTKTNRAKPSAIDLNSNHIQLEINANATYQHHRTHSISTYNKNVKKSLPRLPDKGSLISTHTPTCLQPHRHGNYFNWWIHTQSHSQFNHPFYERAPSLFPYAFILISINLLFSIRKSHTTTPHPFW